MPYGNGKLFCPFCLDFQRSLHEGEEMQPHNVRRIPCKYFQRDMDEIQRALKRFIQQVALKNPEDIPGKRLKRYVREVIYGSNYSKPSYYIRHSATMESRRFNVQFSNSTAKILDKNRSRIYEKYNMPSTTEPTYVEAKINTREVKAFLDTGGGSNEISITKYGFEVKSYLPNDPSTYKLQIILEVQEQAINSALEPEKLNHSQINIKLKLQQQRI